MPSQPAWFHRLDEILRCSMPPRARETLHQAGHTLCPQGAFLGTTLFKRTGRNDAVLSLVQPHSSRGGSKQKRVTVYGSFCQGW